jgi:diguanylate cyclase (GGDEF)-like protein
VDVFSARGARNLLSAVLLGLLFMSQALALDPHRRLIELDLRSWETQHGLPHNMVQSIAQTPDGYLWLATWEGVARFNGFEFTVYNTKNQPALQDRGVRSLLVSSDGTLWMGTSGGGLSYIRNNIWRHLGVADGLAGDAVLALAEDSQNQIWVGSEENGLSIIDGQKISVLSVADGLPDATVLAIAELAPGEMWVATRRGISRIKGGQIQSFDQRHGLPAGPVLSVTAARAGELFVGTEDGVYRWTGEGFEPDEVWAESGSGQVSELFEDSDGNLWAGTFARGLYRLRSQGSEFLRTVNGLPNNRVSSIFEDQEGNLWVGTSGGLARLKSAPFSVLNMRNGLPDNYVRTVFESDDGTLWVGTSNGLARLVGNDMRVFTTADGLTSNSILAVHESRSGALWIGTYGTGINILSAKGVRVINSEDGLPSNHVRSFLETEDSMWVATIRGLARFVGEQQVEVLGRDDGLPREFITSLHEDADGTLWIGTTEGFAFYKDGKVISASEIPGYESSSVFGFYRDHQGNMWIATETGLLRYFDGELRAIRRAQGLPHEVLFGLVGDHQDGIWMSSNDGVFRAAISDLVAVTEGEIGRINIERFTEDHGLASRQCNGGSQPSLIRSSTGRLWFATSQGAAVVDPDILDSERSSTVAPRVLIERVVVDGVEAKLSAEIEVPPGATHLEFHYAGLSFRAAENIRYHYQLAGFERGPTNADLDRVAHYTNLDPGQYTFQVWGSLDPATWSELPGVVRLKVLPEFWETGLFIGFSLALLLLTMWTLVRIRIRSLRRRAEALGREVATQTRDLHEKTSRLELAGEEKSRLLIKLEEQSLAFARQAREDALTGLANRRHFDQIFEGQFEKAQSSGGRLSVALMDLDHFKRINDDFSHQVGDEVLKVVANLMREACAEDDTPARYGGEEFVMLFPNTDVEHANARCNALRESLSAYDFDRIAKDLKVTISGGICGDLGVGNFEKMLSNADQKLYQAKHSGRNRICC